MSNQHLSNAHANSLSESTLRHLPRFTNRKNQTLWILTYELQYLNGGIIDPEQNQILLRL